MLTWSPSAALPDASFTMVLSTPSSTWRAIVVYQRPFFSNASATVRSIPAHTSWCADVQFRRGRFRARSLRSAWTLRSPALRRAIGCLAERQETSRSSDGRCGGVAEKARRQQSLVPKATRRLPRPQPGPNSCCVTLLLGCGSPRNAPLSTVGNLAGAPGEGALAQARRARMRGGLRRSREASAICKYGIHARCARMPPFASAG